MNLFSLSEESRMTNNHFRANPANRAKWVGCSQAAQCCALDMGEIYVGNLEPVCLVMPDGNSSIIVCHRCPGGNVQ